jgi:hypothetical protein
MRTFAVDDDLVSLIWERASPEPFEQLTFSDALRRVLNAPAPRAKAPDKSADELLKELDALPNRPPRKRAPKADLRQLVRLGKLREGQELVLVDYRRQPQPDMKAVIVGGDLMYKGKAHSMSSLAERLLKRAGYSSDAVRGPEHWATAEGKLVKDLWQEVIGSRS